MDPKDIDLSGSNLASVFVLNGQPLEGIAAGERFNLVAEPLTEQARARLKAAEKPFDERRPVYALYYQHQLVGFTSSLEAPVRELLKMGYHVSIDAERTEAPLHGYEGVTLHMPGEEPLENWAVLARYGVAAAPGSQVLVANLNLTGDDVQLPNGPVTVRVGELDGDYVPVAIEAPDGQSDSYELDPRQHSYKVFRGLLGRTIKSAVCVHKDSWTERGERYMRVYLAV
ncbi:hypothetical protein QJ043_02100 [Olsenella sp. YH-ols2217]|uniref:HIRAN domain-containing protein n=1 Tax=Kribbibacterium absianum TaxID=3044210 RepID=A0ABT6ZJ95_9ACTN|nr:MULTISPECIES: hypothetical protein [unclassified Olsenella]MDJ1121384.1 hypothetical protein [Olsenella sp. YH-ols2216]MDJ1128874.1 hypothetical protein [Olsenella sp. YH-ols2217]